MPREHEVHGVPPGGFNVPWLRPEPLPAKTDNTPPSAPVQSPPPPAADGDPADQGDA